MGRQKDDLGNILLRQHESTRAASSKTGMMNRPGEDHGMYGPKETRPDEQVGGKRVAAFCGGLRRQAVAQARRASTSIHVHREALLLRFPFSRDVTPAF